MPTPQDGIFREDSHKYYYLEYQRDPKTPIPVLQRAIRGALQRQSKDIEIIIAFGKQTWNYLNPQWEPGELQDFEELQGSHGFSIPSTQRDIFYWIHSKNHDDNFDQVLNIQKSMGATAVLKLDLAGFTYHDSRDLIGFIDGSANPKDDDRQRAALIPERQTGAGGSYVLTQKWVHNLAAFNSLSQTQQEKIIGRTKVDSIELEGDAMPKDSHVSRTDVTVDGKAMKIYRRSAPYGSATEHGLYFIAFACEISRISIQLKRMFGLTEDKLYDKIVEYSKPVTSSYWFAPSKEDLASMLEKS
ncbi:Dyp-type peroxidase [Deltaproteobacteria bacterium TL4]